MAFLLTSVFGVTGCGSNDDVEVESRIKNGVFAKFDGVVAGTPDSFKPNILGISKLDCEQLDLEEVLDGYLLDRNGNALLAVDGLSGFSGLLELHDYIHDLKPGGLTMRTLRYAFALLDRMDIVIEKCSMDAFEDRSEDGDFDTNDAGSSENDELKSLENKFDDQTDDAVQFQSRSKNAAPGIDASGAPSEADCDGVYDLRDLLRRWTFQETVPTDEEIAAQERIGNKIELLYNPDHLDLLDRLYDNDLLGNLDNLDRLYDYTDLLDRLYYDIGYDLDFDALRDDLVDLHERNCEQKS